MLAAVCLAAAVAAGCDGSAAGRQATTATAGAPPPTATAPVESTSPAAPPAELTLAFAGDVHFTGRTAGLLRRPATAFGPIASLLSTADLTVLNLETAVTERGRPQPKQYVFRAPASAYAAVRAAGVDAVSLANNHALDYGRVGLADSLEAAQDAGMPVFGAGRDAAAAYAPWIAEVDGVRVAVLGFSQIRTLASAWAARDDRSGIAMAWEVDRAARAVAQARQQADLVIVFNHWGRERDECPTADQRSFARRLAAAGADIIVGTHAHVLQGAGWLGDTYVAYGLGNFLWYSGTPTSSRTGVLRLTTRGRTVIKATFLPAVVSSTGQPRALTATAAAQARQRFAALRSCTGLAAGPRS